MWKADKDGHYRFSDRGDRQSAQFFSMLDDDQLAYQLAEKFAGQTQSESQVRDFVLTETPFYKFKNPVNKLRTVNRATPRQRGKWPVTFAAK